MSASNLVEYENLIRLTRAAAPPAEIESLIGNFLSSPEFHRLQIFSNQALRILDTSRMKYLYVSPSNQELTGFSPEEIQDGGILFAYRRTHIMDILRLAKATRKVKNRLKTLTPEEKMRTRFSYDGRFTCKNGEVKKVLQNAHTLKLTEDHEPLVVLFASTDITPYKSDSRMHYSLSLYQHEKGFITLLKDSIEDADCPLSTRELEVLSQTANGFSVKQIADQLSLSLETVKTHRRNMLQKVDVKNTVEMVRVAIAKNWI